MHNRILDPSGPSGLEGDLSRVDRYPSLLESLYPSARSEVDPLSCSRFLRVLEVRSIPKAGATMSSFASNQVPFPRIA